MSKKSSTLDLSADLVSAEDFETLDSDDDADVKDKEEEQAEEEEEECGDAADVGSINPCDEGGSIARECLWRCDPPSAAISEALTSPGAMECLCLIVEACFATEFFRRFRSAGGDCAEGDSDINVATCGSSCACCCFCGGGGVTTSILGSDFAVIVEEVILWGATSTGTSSANGDVTCGTGSSVSAACGGAGGSAMMPTSVVE